MTQMGFASSIESWKSTIKSHPAFQHDDPFLSSIVGTCMAPKPTSSFDKKLAFFPTSEWEKPLEVLYHHEEKASELLVIVPGLFTTLSDYQANRLALDTVSMGKSVVVFPNPLSIDVISKKPPYTIGNTFVEAEHYLLFINKLRAKYLGKYKTVNILGVSHGGFVASVMAAKALEFHIKVEKVVLISPPYQFYDSIVKVDGYLDEVSEDVSYWSEVTDMFFLVQVCLFDSISDDKKFVYSQSRNIVLRKGFYKYFIGALETFEPDKVPDREWGWLSEKYTKWAKGQRFSGYLKKFDKKLFSRFNSLEGSAEFWLKRFEKKGGKWKVVSSNNDFINERNIWKKKKNVLLFERGGHFAFRGLKNLSHFISDLYKSL